jgi:predicted dithiol-disulfide oxidoreductase (DUF899 family)
MPYQFKNIWLDAYPAIKSNQEVEKAYQYAFSFDSSADVASCRSSYADADSISKHLKNVDKELTAVLQGPATLLRMELHAPASEIEKLRPKLSNLGCRFFVTSWGFRNAVIDPHALELTDTAVTLAPYFRIKDLDKFKRIWQEAYANFAHKEDCVHYAFCFTDDNRAHCREAYASAEKVLQHLADVDKPLKAVLNGPAELERLEVHGPKAEVDQLRDALSPLNCFFYVAEWGNRPARPAMENDTVCHLYPYFKLKQPEEFRKIWRDGFQHTAREQEVEKSYQYVFTFEPTENLASCRQSYADADSILRHLKRVDAPITAALKGPARLFRMEVHAPASEIKKLRPKLASLGCQFFTTAWGFRNAVVNTAPAKALTDNAVTLAPYFKVKDLDTFKRIWKADYKKFAHKEDCVHYAFCFTDDNRAHCREAYPNAEKVLQHLSDVDAPLKAVLDGAAELERLEVHGPKAEIDKLRCKLSPLGCHFYEAEWGNRPAKPAMKNDTVCHLYPYFKLKQPAKFRKIWYDAFPATMRNQEAEKSHQYAFSFEPTEDIASCRESYGDASGIQLHLKNVEAPLKAVLNGPAKLLRLEVHAPASEIEKLRPTLAPLGCEFFTTGWGFRNAVIDSSLAKELSDNAVTLAPYFKIKDIDEFKRIWQEDYQKFAHRDDCVHYAFCFTDDSRAHCRGAYRDADKVLQHLHDVEAPLTAVLKGVAELERLEVHGPKAEVDKLREALNPLGCLFYVAEWGNRPARPAMENDRVCHLYPYFKLKQPDEFRKIWYDAFSATKRCQEEEKSHQYAFSFEPTANVASCRESYGDAEGVLLHLKNVDTLLKKVLNGPAEMLRLELHAPASEIDKLKPTLEPLGCEFFTTGWGFRNAVT